MPAAANLCTLTGVSWVRDKLRWDEIEPQRGQFADNTRYDKSAQIQFGIVRPDLSPRPAYCALAAVGRLLADASPLGRLKTPEQSIRAYNFSDKPLSGKLHVTAPPNWLANVKPELQLAPNSDIDLQLELTTPSAADAQFGRVTITGEFGPDNQAVLSLRFKLNQ
ncbi:MAG: hypothetical protein QHJ82_16970 [Verrucomicrobiota bacterium]|nr:hypothetical protein [Verrucomicrobiota bacterium]